MLQLTETASATPGTGSTRKHCWECQRRRLVCDSVRPVCNRCRNNEVVCPGYGENKPLRWVKPGRVTTRNRRRPKAGAAVRLDLVRDDVDVQNSPMSIPSSEDGEFQALVGGLPFFNVTQPVVLDPIMRYDITCDEPSRVEASYIYGMELYNSRSPLTILLENNTQESLPPSVIAPFLPRPVRGLFILLALGHQLFKLPRDADKDVCARLRSAVAFWAYQVIHDLNEEIANEELQASDGTMAAVIMFLWEDQQYQPSTRWRFHFSGLMKMIQLRGGIERFSHDSPHMRNGILTMVALEAFANTTSPSHDQLFHLTHPRNLPFLQALWEDGIQSVYVGSICPPALFAAVVKINYLRALSHRSPTTPHVCSDSFSCSTADGTTIHNNAQTILGEIQAFSPSVYADQHGGERTRDKWLLVARIHQRAVLLYCLLSLRNRFLFTEFKGVAATHYDGLLIDLKEGFRHSHLRNCLFWPLLVAGAGAVSGTVFERAFVADFLRDSVGDMGGAMPLRARALLMQFWASGLTGWDDCFDQPFVFLT